MLIMSKQLRKLANQLKMVVKKCEFSAKEAIDYAAEQDEDQGLSQLLGNKIDAIDLTYSELYNIIEKMLVIIETIKDEFLKDKLLKIMLAVPDYAGLDKLADDAASNASSAEDLNCIFFAHDIFLGHTNLMADKILDILEGDFGN